MIIEKDKVVTFFYSLKEEGGSEVESNHDDIPMAILVGHGNVLQGVEDALIGKAEGDSLSVTLPPEKAYGLRIEDRTQKVPIKHLAGKYKRLVPGMIVKVNTEKGLVDATVIKPSKFMVSLDMNHPFAGKTLVFEINIRDVREATKEELSHGHAHGLGGHNH